MSAPKNLEDAATAGLDGDAAKQDEDLDSIMQELANLDQEVGMSATTEATAAAPNSPEPVTNMRQARRARMSAASSAAPTTQALTLELTGSLNLKLSFSTGARQVELVCTEDALVCRFGDGTEVRIPTENPKAISTKRSVA